MMWYKLFLSFNSFNLEIMTSEFESRTADLVSRRDEVINLSDELFQKLEAFPPGRYWCMSSFREGDELDLFLVDVKKPRSLVTTRGHMGTLVARRYSNNNPGEYWEMEIEWNKRDKSLFLFCEC